MILIISHPADVHARAVSAVLCADGRRVVIADAADFGDGALLAHTIGDPTATALTTRAGEHVRLADVESVWYRRPRPAEPSRLMRDPADRRFAEREWHESFEGLLVASGAPLISPPAAQRAAVKPVQLELARELGLLIPDTLVTNDRAAALEFVERHGGHVIHKTLTGPEDSFAETRRWHDRDRSDLDDLIYAPTIFQAEITGARDIRTTVVGHELYSMSIGLDSGLVDSRLHLDADCRPVELPDAVAAGLLALMARLGLRFGTLDLRVTPAGEYVFLEVNPQGQFLYVEVQTGLPLTAAVAGLLAHPDAGDPVYSTTRAACSRS